MNHIVESTFPDDDDGVSFVHLCTIPMAMRNLGWTRNQVLDAAMRDGVAYDARPMRLPGLPKLVIPLSWVELQGVSTTPVEVVI